MAAENHQKRRRAPLHRLIAGVGVFLVTVAGLTLPAVAANAAVDPATIPAPTLVPSEVCAGAEELSLPVVDGVTYQVSYNYNYSAEDGPRGADVRVVAVDAATGEEFTNYGSGVARWNLRSDNLCLGALGSAARLGDSF